MRLRLKQPGFWLSVALSLMVIGLQTTLSMPVYMLDMASKQMGLGALAGFASHPLTLAMINLLAVGATIAFGLFLNRMRFWTAFEWRPPSLGQVAGLVVAMLGCILVISEADNLLRMVLPVPEWFLKFMETLTSEGHAASRFFLLVIVAPFTEELLFRGIILRGLLGRWNAKRAILVSSLLFALIHLNPWQFVTAMLLGCMLGWVYLRTGSVWLCVLGHAIVNGAFFLSTTLEPNIPGVTPPSGWSEPSLQPWWLDLIGVGLLLAGIWMFRNASSSPPVEDPEDPPVIRDYIPPVPPVIPSP